MAGRRGQSPFPVTKAMLAAGEAVLLQRQEGRFGWDYRKMLRALYRAMTAAQAKNKPRTSSSKRKRR